MQMTILQIVKQKNEKTGKTQAIVVGGIDAYTLEPVELLTESLDWYRLFQGAKFNTELGEFVLEKLYE